MGHTALDILTVKPLIKGDGRIKIIDQRIGFLAESPGPQFHKRNSSLTVVSFSKRINMHPARRIRRGAGNRFPAPAQRPADYFFFPAAFLAAVFWAVSAVFTAVSPAQ